MNSWFRNLTNRFQKHSDADSFDTPVVIIIFNRPDQASNLMAILRDIRPRQLFVVADGPRAGHEGEEARCDAARRAVLDAVTWPAKVHTTFSDINLGCRRRVSSGLDWVFSQVTEAIILEDDVQPHPTFFPFCSQLLRRYRRNAAVGAISGNSFQPEGFNCGASYYFSVYPHCWGWATWRRAWKFYDHDLVDWPEARKKKRLVEWFGHQGEADYWKKTLNQVASGALDSWAMIWTFSQLRGGMLTALPSRNLVSNHGFVADATHTVNQGSPLARLPVYEMGFPLAHPPEVRRHLAADEYSRHSVFHVRRDVPSPPTTTATPTTLDSTAKS